MAFWCAEHALFNLPCKSGRLQKWWALRHLSIMYSLQFIRKRIRKCLDNFLYKLLRRRNKKKKERNGLFHKLARVKINITKLYISIYKEINFIFIFSLISIYENVVHIINPTEFDLPSFIIIWFQTMQKKLIKWSKQDLVCDKF